MKQYLVSQGNVYLSKADTSQVAHQAGAYLDFCSMKRIFYFCNLLPSVSHLTAPGASKMRDRGNEVVVFGEFYFVSYKVGTIGMPTYFTVEN